ncbi:hypothetical protein DERF_006173 [Dermatophagoides farinae]|uniref:Uncharacterized protein n=1 Tax=Dermatophagoides farinae TaxID=6954 RepID=A0A922I4Z0_DERFA|nr:hypothetical protein DERF_006173 [Dermatophagoides farinae]
MEHLPFVYKYVLVDLLGLHPNHNHLFQNHNIHNLKLDILYPTIVYHQYRQLLSMIHRLLKILGILNLFQIQHLPVASIEF